MLTMRSICPFCCLSISMWAQVASRMALMLHPCLPITLLIADPGTVVFFELKPFYRFSFLQLHNFATPLEHFKRHVKSCNSLVLEHKTIPMEKLLQDAVKSVTSN